MTNDDEKQLAELASQRRDIAARREELQAEIHDLSGRLFLINHREQGIREGIPQAVLPAAVAKHPSDNDRSRTLHDGLPVAAQTTSGVVAGPAELEAMGLNQRQDDHHHKNLEPAAVAPPDNRSRPAATTEATNQPARLILSQQTK